jgi:hypothetical protein
MKRAARAHTLTYPKTFGARRIAANGTKLYVRVGGRGPAVVLLHGYGKTGDMWGRHRLGLRFDFRLIAGRKFEQKIILETFV